MPPWAARVDRLVQRQPVHLEDLVFLRGRLHGDEVAGQEQVDHLGEHAGRAQVFAELVPASGAHAGFLGQFADGALDRRLAAVELAGRQFVQPAAGRVPELAQQADAPVGVQRDDRGPAGMVRDLEFGDPAVRQPHLLEVQRQYSTLEDVPDLFGHVARSIRVVAAG